MMCNCLTVELWYMVITRNKSRLSHNNKILLHFIKDDELNNSTNKQINIKKKFPIFKKN